MSEQQTVEWVGGRVPFAASIASVGSTESALTLWVELPALHVVGQLLEDPSEPETTFAQSLMRAMAAPRVGPSRRPQRVRVATEELAAQLRGLSMVEVVVGPTPELDRVVQSLDAFLGQGSYFSDPELTTEQLHDFFEASRALYQAQPWAFTLEDAMLYVDLPELGVEGGCLAVMGAEGGLKGFVLYPTIDHYHQLLDAEADEAGVVRETESAFYLVFEDVAEVLPAMRDEAAAAGWPLPALETYPVLSRAVDGRAAPILHPEVRLATLLARALADFATKHRAALEDYGEHPVRESYRDARGAEATLTVPHPEVDLSDDESAPRAETLPGVANPYELPLSPRELARLENALSKFTLHKLLGMLTAVASVPELVPPTRWLPLISDELKVNGPTEYRAVIDLIMTVYNEVVERVQAYAHAGLIPIEEAASECRDWARGYALIGDASKLASLKGLARRALEDVLALAEKGPHLATALAGAGRADKDGYLAELREELVDNVYALFEAWQDARLEDAQSQVSKLEPVRVGPKTGRNDPCPCGSGKKFKKCCG